MSDPADGTPNRPQLTHLSEADEARMVDVSAKDGTTRRAVARGHIRMQPETLELIERGDIEKGEVLGPARLAGIMAAKRTGELIPLCHVLPAVSVAVELELDRSLPGIVARATATIHGQTGVELEALTAVSVALLTVYDMAKAVDRGMEIGAIRLLSKSGGRSGSWVRE